MKGLVKTSKGKIMTTKTKNTMNATATKVIKFLETNKGKRFTLNEIADGIGVEMKSSGSISRLIKSEKNPDGKIISHSKEKTIEVDGNRAVSTYEVAEKSNADGIKSENPKKIYNFLAKNKGKKFTLNEIADGIETPMKSSGALVKLIADGKVVVHEKGATVPCKIKRQLTTYEIA
jgi:hypothetical protein